ncbi:MAG: 6-bladed beta-propeller [Acidobacteria bacterium]|nr:6-bladed beta-propeller [Acidobacteriota bacterium]MBI3655760.1 6-bladed beta-propeller [Acidobacteriota bacterium]
MQVAKSDVDAYRRQGAKGLVLLLWLGFLLAAPGYVYDKEKTPTKAEITWPPAPQTPRIRFIDEFSSPKDLGTKRPMFKRLWKKIIGVDDREPGILQPYGVVTDSLGRIIVTDTKLRSLHIFDRQSRKYSTIQPPKGETFVSPIGLAVDGEDTIYLSDSYTGKIFAFDKSGKFKSKIGEKEGLFKRPTGLAINKNLQRLYIVDTLKNEVVVYDLQGHEQFRFGRRGVGKGEFNYPTHICLDRQGRIYITDALNARIQIFDEHGNFLSLFGRLGNGSGDLDKPKGVAVDSEGHVYVVEGLHDVVQVFDARGTFLLSFGETGSSAGHFYLPSSIYIDDHDFVYVADSYNRRVQIFKYLRPV